MILVFGSTGQVARELRRLAPEARFLGRDIADLTDPQACAEAIRAALPKAVINAAAYTAVDQAETEEEIARRINSDAPGAMARACAELGVPLVHISTDYVFAGDGRAAWTPTNPASPQNAYGRSKLAGEQQVAEAGGPHAVLRTSWVFSTHGRNFVKAILQLGATRDRLTIVADQIGGPTPACAIACACLTIAETLQTTPEKSGIYHFSGAPDVSWADFAREIFAQAELNCAVEDIPTSAYPTPATRPMNSRLDCSTTTKNFALSRPDWRASLSGLLKDLNS